jgi:hypothetical protein
VLSLTETCRHEITSWRIDGAEEIDPAVSGNPYAAVGLEAGSHVVLVVDHSGSMRKVSWLPAAAEPIRGFSP